MALPGQDATRLISGSLDFWWQEGDSVLSDLSRGLLCLK